VTVDLKHLTYRQYRIVAQVLAELYLMADEIRQNCSKVTRPSCYREI
jgi:hypothetical protein